MKNIKIDIKAEDLRKKLNIQDGKPGYTPVKRVDYIEGETPVINTSEIALQASTLAQVELEKKIVPVEPFKLSDKDIEDISLDVQSQLAPKLNEEIDSLKKGFSNFKPTGGNTEVFEDGIKVGSGQALNFGAGFDVTHDGHRATITLDALEPTNFTLQAVTDNGNTTTNTIEVAGLDVGTSAHVAVAGEAYFEDTDILMVGGGITADFINENDVVVTATNYTALNQGQTIIATQPVTISLPQIDTVSKKITISHQATGEVTINAFSGDLVHDDTTLIISNNNSTVQLKSSSIGWIIV